MSPGDWISLAGVLVVLVLAGLGAFWKLNDRISANSKALHDKVEEVRRDYVRRDDLRDDINRIERSQENLSAKMDGMVNAIVPAMSRMTEAALSMRSEKN